MKIGVLSDIHDNIDNLNVAVEILKKRGIEVVFVLGDLICPNVAKILGDNFSGYCIRGNNDGDIVGIQTKLGKNIKFFPNTYAIVEFENKSFFMTHYDDLASTVNPSHFDFVFYGHNHTKFSKNINDCLILNPGEIGHMRNKPSFAIVDLDTKEYEFIDL